MYGKVTKYFKDRGFGFIRGEDGNTYFIHRSNLYSKHPELTRCERKWSDKQAVIDYGMCRVDLVNQHTKNIQNHLIIHQ